MTAKQNPKFQELVAKLREIFQIDRPELDFGIYRILNARAGEINDYLQNRLAEKVQQALSAGSAASAQQLQAELQEAEKNAQALGVSPDAVPKVQELRARLKETAAGSSEHENAVFSHLLTFFSRYYDQGDFISQRRYKGDTYAIPYAGEEVVLYWANKDQYYTKSGETFSNYSFKLEDGRTVHFRLAAADTAKDNRKDNDKERRFALVAAKTVTRVDENGDEVEEELVPVEEASGSDGNQELIIRFEYAAQPKGTKQEALVTKAVEAVLADAAVKARWLALGNRAPTEKSPQRTLLQKHLSDYTTKNTADYFIHKDLGGFLRRELDFYIKNEVMHLDDVQNAGAFADIEKNLRMIQCLRSIALDLITFLAQLENFQKKLWLKKKFVVSNHYCITLDRVPEELWPEVVANERQWAQWQRLGVWDGDAPGTVADVRAAPHRMVDTSLFSEDFKFRLMRLTDVDVSTDGVLVHSDNFQGLRSIENRYKEQIKCVYIDPPYNTSEATFFYKNQYKHSSWLAMMNSRLERSLGLMTEDAILQITIDDEELYRLKGQVDSLLGEERYIGTVVIQSNPRGRGINSFFATSHEYAVSYAKNPAKAEICDEILSEEHEEGYKYSDERSEYRLLPFRRSGGLSTPVDRPNSEFSLLLHPITLAIVGVGGARTRDYPATYCTKFALWLSDAGDIAEENYSNYLNRTGCIEFLPVDSDGERRVWRWSDRKKILEHARDGEFVVKRKGNGEITVQLKDRIKEGRKPKTVWVDSKYDSSSHGTNLLADFFGGQKLFGYPKSIHSTVASVSAVVRKSPDAIVLDYFAGSGTTGHAVVALNRSDRGKRKYLLIEQGEYFDLVTKPRMQKVVYSEAWKNGKPVSPEKGISHCFKVLKLESYEDTLNNLQLRRASAQGDLLNTLPQQAKDDYLLNYLLDVESRGSLLSVEDFKKPFDYTLNVAVDSAGAFEPRKIDLVETFNFLIGLRVKHIDAQPQRGFITVTGTLPSGESCLVLWRDCDVLDYEGVSKLCDKLAINPADNEFDVVYINGDHNIPTVLTQTTEEGGATRVLKLRQIEPEFLEHMFSVEDI